MNANQTSVDAGLAIAKASLELHLLGQSYDRPNTPAGHAQLLKRLAAVPGAHLICEATGGYERAVVAARHAAPVPGSVINPARVRQFARAAGQLAKTDPIDAAVLTAFGVAFAPRITAARTTVAIHLAALTTRRAQWLQLRIAEEQRAETGTETALCQLFTGWLAQVHKQLAKVEALTEKLLAEQTLLAAQVQRLDDLMGVGRLTAVTVLAALPELGTLNRGQAAALAGLAPDNRDRGTWAGQRHSSGGRAAVRCARYMAAWSASRSNQILKPFYDRLIAAGKPAQVALPAGRRKLIVLMNHLLKNPDFTLAK